MSKFCGNCGAKMEDDARVCGRCGTPVDGKGVKISGLRYQDPEKKKKIVKGVKIVAILAVVAIVIAAGLNIASNFIGNKGLVRKVMAACKDYDIDKLVSLSSDVYYYDDNEDYTEQYFENGVGVYLDDFELSVGHSYKFSYKVEEIYNLSDRKKDELLETLEYSYPEFDIDSIKKVAVADVTVTAKQDGKSKSRNLKITMTKEGKKWKLLYFQ